ncbi:MAG TPA: hypothetical protein VG893_02465 [Terracidiphilus sp.]|nr:hypothetical protein [Terracidiphilus sp.]
MRLYEQGQSETAIAHTLDTSTKVVESYLGVTLGRELRQNLQLPEVG